MRTEMRGLSQEEKRGRSENGANSSFCILKNEAAGFLQGTLHSRDDEREHMRMER
jgi:hypothetical protein